MLSRLCALLLGLLCAGSPLLATAVVAEQPESHPRHGLPNFFQKLQEGKDVAIAYFGSSITSQDGGWRTKTLKWFRQQYTNSNIDEIQACIGGTGSELGVFRFQHDVTSQQPDLVFVEFAVNDLGMPVDQLIRCMEGIVRQGWKADPTMDFCFVYTINSSMLKTYQAGRTPRSVTAMEAVAQHYGIPTINLGLQVARLEQEGKLVFKGSKPKTPEETAALRGKILFSHDATHPYPEGGHDLYVETIVRAMPGLRAVKASAPHELGDPLMSDNYEKAKMIPLSRAKLSPGWKKLVSGENALRKRFKKHLPELWSASQPGESISLKFKGRAVGIYDVIGPDCGQVKITLDDKPAMTKARFDSWATYHRLAHLKISESLPNEVHTLKVEVHPESPDKVKLLEERKVKMDDPKKYEGTVWYAGAVLLVGDLVKEDAPAKP